jgi:hypothetical protein
MPIMARTYEEGSGTIAAPPKTPVESWSEPPSYKPAVEGVKVTISVVPVCKRPEVAMSGVSDVPVVNPERTVSAWKSEPFAPV